MQHNYIGSTKLKWDLYKNVPAHYYITHLEPGSQLHTILRNKLERHLFKSS